MNRLILSGSRAAAVASCLLALSLQGNDASAQAPDYPTTALYRATQLSLLVDKIRLAIQNSRPDDLREVIAEDFHEPHVNDRQVIRGRDAALNVLEELARAGRRRRLPRSLARVPPLVDFQLRRGTGVGVNASDARSNKWTFRYRVQFAGTKDIRPQIVELSFQARQGRWQLTHSDGLFRFLSEAATRMGN
jgi:hypothetical protein